MSASSCEASPLPGLFSRGYFSTGSWHDFWARIQPPSGCCQMLGSSQNFSPHYLELPWRCRPAPKSHVDPGLLGSGSVESACQQGHCCMSISEGEGQAGWRCDLGVQCLPTDCLRVSCQRFAAGSKHCRRGSVRGHLGKLGYKVWACLGPLA